jgi:hypothetical protein
MLEPMFGGQQKNKLNIVQDIDLFLRMDVR